MSNTHMGQPPKNHVTLRTMIVEPVHTPTDLRLLRIKSNGVLEDDFFRIPAGRVLVVTDVDWQFRYGTPGQIQILIIDIKNISGSKSFPVFCSAITLDSRGNGATTEAMTSGFILSSDARILFSTFPGGGLLMNVIIRGYLCSE